MTHQDSLLSPPEFLNILLCQCGPGFCFRGRVLGVGVWEQAQLSVTETQFWFLLVNHLILWRISMKVVFMTWKQVWIYGQKWMWLQWGMEHFLRHFTLRCVYFGLLLVLSSSWIMCCGVLLICWCGLLFGEIEDLLSASRLIKMFLLRCRISMASIDYDLDDIFQEWPQSISQK